MKKIIYIHPKTSRPPWLAWFRQKGISKYLDDSTKVLILATRSAVHCTTWIPRYTNTKDLLDWYTPTNNAVPDITPRIVLETVSQAVCTGSAKNVSIITTNPIIKQPSRRSMQQQYCCSMIESRVIYSCLNVVPRSSVKYILWPILVFLYNFTIRRNDCYFPFPNITN